MDNVYGTIYKITNNITGKSYIGQTTMPFNKRYSGGNWFLHTSNYHLKSSAKKYGAENFSVVECFDYADSKDELDKKEIYWIEYYNTLNPKLGYNKKSGGANGKFTGESLKKLTMANRRIADLKRGIKRPETGKAISEALHKKFVSNFDEEYSNHIQEMLDDKMRKQDICLKENISMWQLDKIIDIYNLSFFGMSSMAGNCGEKHHSYGKQKRDETKEKVKATFLKSFEERWGKDVPKIKKMLDERISISEISRIYNCSRSTMRKVIKYYELESHGMSVKKTINKDLDKE